MLLQRPELSRRISAANMKVTAQRLAIYAELCSRTDHPSPELLFRALQADLPRLSLATVYKTLDSFESAGLVSQLSLADEDKRYDANLEPHHHLICTECHCIIDFQDASLSSLHISPPGHGFLPAEIKIEITGICADCQVGGDALSSIVSDPSSAAIKS